jgi:hypothetical protein
MLNRCLNICFVFRGWLTKQQLAVVLISLTGLLVIACGGGNPNQAAGVTLGQRYDQDGIGFQYPDGWVVSSADGAIFIASSQGALDSAQAGGTITTLSAGEMVITMLVFGADVVNAIHATRPSELLVTMTQATSGDGVNFNEPTEATFGGKAAAQVTGSTSTTDVEFVAVRLDDGDYILLGGAAPTGDLSKLNTMLQAILGTVTINGIRE